MNDRCELEPLIDLGDVFDTRSGVLVVTSVDHQKKDGRFKLFRTMKEYEAWNHDDHALNFPAIHPADCPICKDRAKESK